jgi:hypothetical protein
VQREDDFHICEVSGIREHAVLVVPSKTRPAPLPWPERSRRRLVAAAAPSQRSGYIIPSAQTPPARRS